MDDSAVKSLKDLEGKKIGLSPDPPFASVLKSFLDSKGINKNNINFVQIDQQKQVDSLASGQVDALFSTEPNTAIAISSFAAHRIYGSVFAELQTKNPYAAAALSSKFAGENPELAKKVVSVFDKSVDFIRADNSAAKKIAAYRLNIDPEVANSIELLSASKSTEVDKEKVQEYANLLQRQSDSGSIDLNSLFYS